MRTKTFLLLPLFIMGFGLTRLSAQAWPPPPPDNKNHTGSVVTLETSEFSEPVFSSEGQIIDWLAGPITAHYVRHYKNGVWLSEIADFYGELVSVGLDFESGTGEVFRLKDQYKTREVGVNGDGHYMAKGNLGTYLNIFYHIEIYWSGEPLYSDFLGMDFILVKAVKQ